MSERGVTLLLFFALLIGSGACAICGWVVYMPDGATRYGWRFSTALLTTAAYLMFAISFPLWSWLFWFGAFAFCVTWGSARAAWRKYDMARNLERRQGGVSR